MNAAPRIVMLVLTLVLCAAARANDAPASDESLAELMRLTHAEENFAALKPQIEAMMRKTLDEAVGGKQLNAAQQDAYQRGRERMVTVLTTQFSWDSMRDIYLRAYQAAFTQDELDGIIAFYRTPAGSALIAKMPLLQQNLMQETQSWMRPLMQEFKQIGADMRAEMDRAAKPGK